MYDEYTNLYFPFRKTDGFFFFFLTGVAERHIELMNVT